MLPQVNAHFLCTTAERYYNSCVDRAAKHQPLLDAAVVTGKFWTLALHALLDTWHDVYQRANNLFNIQINSYAPSLKKYEEFFNATNLYHFKFSLHQSSAEIFKYTKPHWLITVTSTDQPSFQLKNLSAPSISLLHFHYLLSLSLSLWLPWFLCHRVLLVTQRRTHTEADDRP